MTLSDCETIKARDINEGRRDVSMAADASCCNVDYRTFSFANCGIANGSAAYASISSSRIGRFVADGRLSDAFLCLATRY